MIDPRLHGRVALVTGANHGIGAATAKALAAQGTRVFITYYRLKPRHSRAELDDARQRRVGGYPLYFALQQQPGEVVVDAIRSHQGTAVAREFDLGEVQNIVGLFDTCEAELGPVEILVINHTHDAYDTFDPALVTEEPYGVRLVDAANIDRHFAVNSRATALLIREYLRRHIGRKAQWGRIVSLTTSIAHAHNVSYAASKNALVSYSLSAAEELGRYGVTVNVVCPGVTQTGWVTPEIARRVVPKTPIGRLGEPEDIADVIVFLTSEQAHWVTGQTIWASGGFKVNG